MNNKWLLFFFSLMVFAVPGHAMFSNAGKHVVLSKTNFGQTSLFYNGSEKKSNNLSFKNKNGFSKCFFSSKDTLNNQKKSLVKFFEDALQKNPDLKETIKMWYQIDSLLSEKRQKKVDNVKKRIAGKCLFLGGATSSVVAWDFFRSAEECSNVAFVFFSPEDVMATLGAFPGGLLATVGLYKILRHPQVNLKPWERLDKKVTEYLLKMAKSKEAEDILSVFFTEAEENKRSNKGTWDSKKKLAAGITFLAGGALYAGYKNNQKSDAVFALDFLFGDEKGFREREPYLHKLLKRERQLFKGEFDKSDLNNSPLIKAIEKASLEEVQPLLEDASVKKYEENDISLLYSVYSEYNKACQDLYELQQPYSSDYSEYGSKTAQEVAKIRADALGCAQYRKNNLEKIFELLLKAEADPAFKAKSGKGSQLLRSLLYADNEPEISALQKRYTAQNNAIDRNIFDLLLKHVDDEKLYECLAVDDDCDSLLAIAFRKRNLYMLQELDKRIDLSKVKGDWSRMLQNLCRTARFHKDDVELAKIAIKFDADLKQTNQHGDTLIDLVVRSCLAYQSTCNLPLVKFLASQGVEPCQGWDAFLKSLCIARFHCWHDLGREANDLQRKRYNQTVVALAEIAIARGADVHQKNDSNETLIDLASKIKNDELRKLLQDSDAEPSRLIE